MRISKGEALDDGTPELASSPALWSKMRVSAVVGAFFGLLVVGMFAWYVGYWAEYPLEFEDIRLLSRGLTLHGLVLPYNDHLSVTPLIAYQVLARMFGIESALPFVVLASAALVGVAVLVAAVVWQRVGPYFGVVAGMALLFLPRSEMVVAAFNHFLALGAIVVCAWLLDAYPKARHWWLAGVLLFAFASSGVAVAGAAGCVIYVVVTRAHWPRLLAVFGPCMVWLGWRTVMRGEMDPSTSPAAGTVWHVVWSGTWSSFQALTFGAWPLAGLLAAAFVALLGLRLSRGLMPAANQLSWTFALLIWWAGLGWSRWWGSVGVFRYDYVGATFVILAFLPTAHGLARRDRAASSNVALPAFMVTWRDGVTRGSAVFHRSSAALVTGLIALAMITVNFPGIRDQQPILTQFATGFERLIVSLSVDPDVASIDEKSSLGFAVLSPDAMREVFARFGTPGHLDQVDTDAWLVASGDIKTTVGTQQAAPFNCGTSGATFELRGGETRQLQSGNEEVTVQVRRIGSRWVDVAQISANRRFTVTAKPSYVDEPWEIQATGACPFP